MAVLAGLVLGFALWKQHAALEQPLALDEAVLLEVQPGDTPGGLFLRLENEGLLDDAFWLRIYWRLNLSGQTLHSGEYQLTPGMSVRDMLMLWRKGEVVQYSLTLVEGWNFRQLLTALRAQTKLEQSLAGLDEREIMARLGKPDLHPEGQFFPDTYNYTRGTSDLDLLKRAAARLESVLQEEWEQRAEGLPYKDAYQALVMASIIGSQLFSILATGRGCPSRTPLKLFLKTFTVSLRTVACKGGNWSQDLSTVLLARMEMISRKAPAYVK